LRVVNEDEKIFGLPLKILDKPNLISNFDLTTNLLEYYSMNAEGTIDENNHLTCTLIKFYLDQLTEY
jgi:hypothetical protein